MLDEKIFTWKTQKSHGCLDMLGTMLGMVGLVQVFLLGTNDSIWTRWEGGACCKFFWASNDVSLNLDLKINFHTLNN